MAWMRLGERLSKLLYDGLWLARSMCSWYLM
jgi:hypothetical protein